VPADSSGHCGRHAQGFVGPAEVVEREPQHNGSPVIVPFLAEGVRQASETSNAHTRAEVGPLNNRSADALWIGAAHDWDLLHRIGVATASKQPKNNVS